jgi:hypothetical protein
MKTDKENKSNLIYWCKNCNHEEKKNLKGNNCVYTSSYTTNKYFDVKYHINKYTHLDPTLPRVNNVPCPNADCSSNKDGEHKEVIYKKYDEENMKFLYLCVKCKTCWRNDLDSVKIE